MNNANPIDLDLVATNHVITMTKLNSKNYNDWTFYISNALKNQGLLKFIEGNDATPMLLTDPKEAKAWQRCTQHAKTQIIQMLENTEVEYVHDQATAWDCWNALKAIYALINLAHQAT